MLLIGELLAFGTLQKPFNELSDREVRTLGEVLLADELQNGLRLVPEVLDLEWHLKEAKEKRGCNESFRIILVSIGYYSIESKKSFAQTNRMASHLAKQAYSPNWRNCHTFDHRYDRRTLVRPSLRRATWLTEVFYTPGCFWCNTLAGSAGTAFPSPLDSRSMPRS